MRLIRSAIRQQSTKVLNPCPVAYWVQRNYRYNPRLELPFIVGQVSMSNLLIIEIALAAALLFLIARLRIPNEVRLWLFLISSYCFYIVVGRWAILFLV